MQRRDGVFLFFYRFYFWDETLLFPSPHHVPVMLSSPHSYNVELFTFLKPCVMKLYGLEVRELY